MLKIFNLALLGAGLSIALMLVTSLRAQEFPAPAPIPAQIGSAKSAFISNAGVDTPFGDYVKFFTGSPEGFYNEFYAAMKSWGKYELVSAPLDADLIFETHFARTYNVPPDDPEFRVTILDPKTHAVLWAFSKSVPAGSGQPAPRRKKFDQAFTAIMDDVKHLTMQSTGRGETPRK